MKRHAWWTIEQHPEYAKGWIGAIVYLGYMPSRVGKVLDCYVKTRPYKESDWAAPAINVSVWLKVKWLKQTKRYPEQVTDIPLMGVQDFEMLVEEHRHKYEKHSATLAEAKKII